MRADLPCRPREWRASCGGAAAAAPERAMTAAATLTISSTLPFHETARISEGPRAPARRRDAQRLVAAALPLGADRRRRPVDGENGCTVTDAADEEVGRIAEYSALRVRALDLTWPR